MSLIDEKGSIASKVAAIYQLRFFPEHREFIINFCDVQSKNIEGEDIASNALADEMRRTKEHLAKL